MNPAGYSSRPLADKLGIKPGMRALFLNPPAGFDETIGPILESLHRVHEPIHSLDFIHAFYTSQADLEAEFPNLEAALAPKGMLWISWPKKASGVPTDLSDAVVRETGLRHGLVDIKVCAVDAVWSGLKFVHRLKR